MHLRRGKEKDLEHAIWIAAHYREHFPIGRTQHIRRSAATCIAHKAWREEWYSKHFIKGGDRQKQNVDAESIKAMIRKAYGEEWGNRVTIVG